MPHLAKTKIKKISRNRRIAGRRQPKIFKLNIFCCILLFGIIAAYLAVLNSTTANGYKLKKIEQQFLNVREENKNLTLEVSDKQSMEKVRERVGQIGMVETNKFDYVSMQPSEVAKR